MCDHGGSIDAAKRDLAVQKFISSMCSRATVRRKKRRHFFYIMPYLTIDVVWVAEVITMRNPDNQAKKRTAQ